MLHSYLLKGNNFREFLRSDNEHAVMHKFNQLELKWRPKGRTWLDRVQWSGQDLVRGGTRNWENKGWHTKI